MTTGDELADFPSIETAMSEPTAPSAQAAPPAVSIVVPVKNESGNIRPLINEIAAALQARWTFEVIYVDDGSRDETPTELDELAREYSFLQVLKHVVSCGQSSAVRSGVVAARAPIVATLDGDGQNDPKFLPDLISALLAAPPTTGLVAGQRVARKSGGFKKLQSRIANEVRNMVLKDGARDSGCGLKAFRRNVFLGLPYFDGLHRFLPALFRRDGSDVIYIDVVDRPRGHGKSNYGLMDRLSVGLLDLFGVWWLTRRRKHIPSVSKVRPDAG
jgi:dolichol-phosphate mannosyltransferase